MVFFVGAPNNAGSMCRGENRSKRAVTRTRALSRVAKRPAKRTCKSVRRMSVRFDAKWALLHISLATLARVTSLPARLALTG